MVKASSVASKVAAPAVFIGTPLVLGWVGSTVTTPAIPEWYEDLRRPSWSPPNWLFGPVWTTLYLAMGIAAWRVWQRRSESPALTRGALAVYAVQLALNASWSPAFFGLKRIDLALAIIVAMVLAIADTIRRFKRVDRAAALLLVPYLGWVLFATALNASIWQLNRGTGEPSVSLTRP